MGGGGFYCSDSGGGENGPHAANRMSEETSFPTV